MYYHDGKQENKAKQTNKQTNPMENTLQMPPTLLHHGGVLFACLLLTSA